MEPVIYLDMDGVCTDFPRAAIKSAGRDPVKVFAAWERDYAGESEQYEVMGIRAADFWVATNYDEAFWVDMEEYPWFRELYDRLTAITRVCFLSSSGNSPSALSGKLKWLQARLGADFQNHIFTHQKHLLAREGAVLVDDYEFYVQAFRRAGGAAVLFPQIWGRNHRVQDKVGFTLGETRRLLGL